MVREGKQHRCTCGDGAVVGQAAAQDVREAVAGAGALGAQPLGEAVVGQQGGHRAGGRGAVRPAAGRPTVFKQVWLQPGRRQAALPLRLNTHMINLMLIRILVRTTRIVEKTAQTCAGQLQGLSVISKLFMDPNESLYTLSAVVAITAVKQHSGADGHLGQGEGVLGGAPGARQPAGGGALEGADGQAAHAGRRRNFGRAR